jgi:hypothetical protein
VGDLLEKMVAALKDAANTINERMAILPEHTIPYDQEAMDFLGRAGIAAVLEAIAEPTEAQMHAAEALPVTGVISGMIMMHAARNGGIAAGSGLPGPPDTPLQQWYRAMIAALRKELEGG